MGLIGRALAVGRAILVPPPPPADEVARGVTAAEDALLAAEIETLRAERDQWKARATWTSATGAVVEWKQTAIEYRDAIGGIIGEKDGWKERWFQHGREHAAAQAKMVDEMRKLVETCRKLIAIANSYRAEKKEPPLGDLKSPIPPMEQLQQAYVESLAAGAASVTPYEHVPAWEEP